MSDDGSDTAVLALTVAARALLASVGHARAPAYLADWPAASSEDRAIVPCGLPVLRWLGDTPQASVPETAGLVRLLVGAADRLAWGQTYSAEDFGAGFLERYGWSELIGRRGPVASERIASGILLLGPEVHYPRHSHEAEELYVPLSGSALWQCGEEGWVRRRPGAPVHHPAWLPHAIRTEAEPLLALYAWRAGDLTQKSRIG